MNEPRRFVGSDGIEYRVLDVAMRKGTMVAANPPAPWATARVFRPKEGQRRYYQFAEGESRDPSDERLAEQLTRAWYLPTEKYDPSERTAR